MGEPLTAGAAKKLIREILISGTVTYSVPHAVKEMEKDGISTLDCENVLRAGVVDEPEWENGDWRYRVRTNTFCFIVVFLSDDHLLVVTAWRLK